MKLHIPKQYQSMIAAVQHCLQLADLQGFNSDIIELVISQDQYIRLSNSCSKNERVLTLSLACSADLMKNDQKADWNLHYINIAQDSFNLSKVKTILEQFPNKIVLGIVDEDEVIDCWLCQSTESESTINCGTNKRAIASPLTLNHQYIEPNNEEWQQRHLAWLLTALCLEFPIEDALMLARAAVLQYQSKKITSDNEWNVSRETWPVERCYFPTPIMRNQTLGIDGNLVSKLASYTFPRLNKALLGLYPVVDDVSWVERLLKLGVKTVQLRIKNPQQVDLEEQILKAITLGNEYKAQVFINDYWQLAIKYRAFGVHLGQEDIEIADLAALAQAGICLGLSTHGYYELLRITQIAPSYIALGHIFPTTTKVMPSKPQGLVRLKLYQKLINSIEEIQHDHFPTVAIGGIDLENASSVWQCGVSSLAVVRAITQADDLKLRLVQFQQLMEVDRV